MPCISSCCSDENALPLNDRSARRPLKIGAHNACGRGATQVKVTEVFIDAPAVARDTSPADEPSEVTGDTMTDDQAASNARLAQATGIAIELLRGASQLEDVAEAVLERLAHAARCEWAAYWVVDPQARGLRAVASWSGLGPEGHAFDRETRVCIPSTNQGNPAKVWRSGKPIWTANLVLDMGLPRSLRAAPAGLRGGMWFAVKSDTAVYGVIELLARALPSIPTQTLVAVERVGSRLGYVIEERRSERASRLH
jgi:two-component system cell cycle sensor histidine kinase/response regulator CckA